LIVALWMWLSVAWGVDADALEATLAEAAPLRDWRIYQAPTPSSGDVRKAAGGTVVTGLLSSNTGSKAYGIAVVPVSIGHFWAALNDETRHPGYTAVDYSELVSGSVCKSGRQVLQYLPVPMLSDRWWVGTLTMNSKLQSQSGGAVRELAFSSSVDPALVSSSSGQKMIANASPIGFSKGSWFLVAVDERHTYVEYFLHTDPGGRIPGGMASMFATKGVRQNIEAIVRFSKEAKPSCAIE
jgi:hypothetical protein